MEPKEKLVRAVGFWGLVAFCINSVVGSGVFLLPSASYNLLGPFSLWAPLIFALPVFILVLCFADAASRFTQPGGAYLYARTAFGDFIGFETGWMNTLARVTSLAALSNGFVLSLARIVPEAGSGLPRAVLITGTLALFATIHAMGIRYGARTIYMFTIAKLAPLLVFIVVALFLFRQNPVPGSMTLPGMEANWSDAALLLLFAYAGFENIAIAAGEYKRPKRDLPIALLTGISAIALIYVLAQFAAMATLPDLSATATPIADAAGILMGPAGLLLVTIGAMISILGTNLGTMLEGSRMIYALSENRRPYTPLAFIHPRFRTPIVAIIVLASVAVPIAIAGSFVQLAVLSAVARMTTYLFTAASVPILRKKLPGEFQAPGGLLIPILGTGIALLLFLTLSSRHLIAAVIALTVGAILYGISRAFGSPPSPEAIEQRTAE
jgi:basic amino acid/polyamine antiporter, APA family